MAGVMRPEQGKSYPWSDDDDADDADDIFEWEVNRDSEIQAVKGTTIKHTRKKNFYCSMCVMLLS